MFLNKNLLQEIEDISFGRRLSPDEQDKLTDLTQIEKIRLFFYIIKTSLSLNKLSSSQFLTWLKDKTENSDSSWSKVTDEKHLRHYGRLATYILTVSRITGVSRTCVPRSAILYLGLRYIKVNATFVIAEIPSSDDAKYLFHAWVEIDGNPINEENYICQNCRILTKISG